ncbi:MAG: hypothetical protein KAU50_04075, partial [Candidatus Marinimicrobia bacterium]|nr:hypothetical protein [Candidatus Neomarinimicrobiota bacterium]
MRNHHLIICTLILFVTGLTGTAGNIEQLVLELPPVDAAPQADEEGRFNHDAANACIRIDNTYTDIFRWVISAAGLEDVSVGLTGARWQPVKPSNQALPDHPMIRVHSSQTWGQLPIVLVDLYPWRINNGRLEALISGSLSVSIRHHAFIKKTDSWLAVHSGTPVANELLERLPRRVTPLARGMIQFPAGAWLKMAIKTDGIYHLTGDELAGYLPNAGSINSDRLFLYAPEAMGRPMNATVGAPMPENLVELPILVRDGGDGVLHGGDDLLFYGQGPRGVGLADSELVYIGNPYASESYFWLLLADLEPA